MSIASKLAYGERLAPHERAILAKSLCSMSDAECYAMYDVSLDRAVAAVGLGALRTVQLVGSALNANMNGVVQSSGVIAAAASFVLDKMDTKDSDYEGVLAPIDVMSDFMPATMIVRDWYEHYRPSGWGEDTGPGQFITASVLVRPIYAVLRGGLTLVQAWEEPFRFLTGDTDEAAKRGAQELLTSVKSPDAVALQIGG